MAYELRSSRAVLVLCTAALVTLTSGATALVVLTSANTVAGLGGSGTPVPRTPGLPPPGEGVLRLGALISLSGVTSDALRPMPVGPPTGLPLSLSTTLSAPLLDTDIPQTRPVRFVGAAALARPAPPDQAVPAPGTAPAVTAPQEPSGPGQQPAGADREKAANREKAKDPQKASAPTGSLSTGSLSTGTINEASSKKASTKKASTKKASTKKTSTKKTSTKTAGSTQSKPVRKAYAR